MINLFEILKLTNTQSLPVIFLQANVNKRGEHKKKKKKKDVDTSGSFKDPAWRKCKEKHFIFSLSPLESGLWEVVAKFVSNHDSQLYPRTVTTIFSEQFIPNVEQNKAFTRSVKSE